MSWFQLSVYHMPKIKCPICREDAKCFHTGIIRSGTWGYEDSYYIKCPNCSYHEEKPGKVLYIGEDKKEIYCPYCNKLMSNEPQYKRMELYNEIRDVLWNYYDWEDSLDDIFEILDIQDFFVGEIVFLIKNEIPNTELFNRISVIAFDKCGLDMEKINLISITKKITSLLEEHNCA